MSQKNEAREWIAAGANSWERRKTRKEALAALKKRAGHKLRGCRIHVLEVPPGAYVDAMGGVCWKWPEGWDDMSPEERKEYGRIESETVPA